MSADDLNLSFDPRPDEPSETLELSEGQNESGTSGPSGPAEGAKQATPGDVLFEGFSGSEDAGDFLGLDTELHFSNDGGGHGHVDTGLGEGDSGLELAEAPGTAADAAPTEAFEATEHGEIEGEYDEEYDEDEEYDDEDYEDEEGEYGEYEEAAGPHKGVLLVSALLVGVLAVAGALYGPGLLEQYTGSGTTTEVAENTPGPARTTATTEPATGATATTATGGETTTDGAAGEGGAEATDPVVDPATGADPESGTDGDAFFASADGATTPPVKNGERGSLKRLFGSDTFTLAPRALENGGATSTQTGGGLGGTSVARTDEPAPVEVSPGLSIEFPGIGTEGAGDDTIFASGLGWADQGDVDVVWRREQVPQDAIDAPARVATPRVGDVRVHMLDGEFFEGRLVAMGEGRVWIQTTPGRMAFSGEDVARIEPLMSSGVTTDPGAIHAPLRGDRVRVRAPGGLIYGHVVAQTEAGEVTLRTDAGGKVTVANAQVETIGSARAMLVTE